MKLETGIAQAEARGERWSFAISARGVRAIVVFVVLMALFYGFVHTPANETTAFQSYLALIARVVGGIIGLFGYEATVSETVIYTPQFALEIVRGCDAIEPAATYIAAVLASPVGIWPKIPGILIGTAAIIVINLVRIVSLFFVGVYYPDSFNLIHEGVWQAAFIVFAIVFWAVWVQWATRKNASHLMPNPKQPQPNRTSAHGERQDRRPLTQPSPPKGGEGSRVPVKSLIAFFGLFLLIFVIFLLLWSPLAMGYGRLFRATSNGLISVEARSRVWFESPEKPTDHHDVQVVVANPKEHAKRSTPISSYRHGYMPTVFLLALTLATPVAWPGRFRAALWGLLWISLYVVLKLLLFPIAYGGDDAIGAWTLAGALRWMFWVVGASSVGWMLPPLLIWVLLTVRTLITPRAVTPH